MAAKIGEGLKGSAARELLGGLRVEIGEQPFAGLMELALADDVVAVKHAAGLCPSKAIATRSGTPARTKLRAAVRRQSCKYRPGT